MAVAAIIALAVLFGGTSAGPEGSLVQLHVVFRHGMRTPASTYPTDPHIKEKFHPYGWGQLTNEGKLNSYRQGLWLRKTYNSFLGDRYSSDEVEAHSTEVARAQMSAATTLAGLFPPVGDQIWNKDLLWQPIPLVIQPFLKDRLLLVRGCPKFNQLLREALDSPGLKESVLRNKELYDHLTSNAGVTVKDPFDVEDIYSTLKAEEGLNLTLPEWTKNVYPSKMEREAARIFTLNTFTDELKRLKGGPLLKKILHDSKAKADGKNEKKLYVYSGHDSTVANLLSTLGSWEEHMPPYNAMAIFELHQIGSDFTLEVKLKNSTDLDPYEQKIPGCPKPCLLSKVLEIAAPLLPDDLDKECEVTEGSLNVMPDAAHA